MKEVILVRVQPAGTWNAERVTFEFKSDMLQMASQRPVHCEERRQPIFHYPARLNPVFFGLRNKRKPLDIEATTVNQIDIVKSSRTVEVEAACLGGPSLAPAST